MNMIGEQYCTMVLCYVYDIVSMGARGLLVLRWPLLGPVSANTLKKAKNIWLYARKSAMLSIFFIVCAIPRPLWTLMRALWSGIFRQMAKLGSISQLGIIQTLSAAQNYTNCYVRGIIQIQQNTIL